MRLALALLALVATPSLAQEAPDETGLCYVAECEGMTDALRDALAAAGLDRVDGLRVHYDGAGGTALTILSTDAVALDRIAPASKAQTLSVRGTDTWSRTIPLALEGLETFSVTGATKYPDVTLKRGGGGGGGGGDCEYVCVCTETGSECWWEC